jgi:CDP-6-deoxy-D-xylo-4-hexulose-3-dehydrase
LKVSASGALITDAEKSAMRSAVDLGWLTAGPINSEFEKTLSDFTGLKHIRTTNSGSSANLLAVAAMVESGRWHKGDKIVTVAASFPTTVNPLILYGLVPVFIDIELGTYNAKPESIYKAIEDYEASGVVMAHTLGNPFHVPLNIPVIEDCCDALGSLDGSHVGLQGRIATFSFFPAHHITTGEGGAVGTQDDSLARHIESLRDWGRDCWCQPGQNNSCGKRFCHQFGALPQGYDHKYTFTHLGYNLKLTEIGAACGVAQMQRLQEFVSIRKRNWAFLRDRLEPLSDRLILPKASTGSDPSWFGFMLTIKEPGLRPLLQSYLSERGVDSRLLFAGNITKQPYMRGRDYRVSGSLENTDKVMNDGLWIGVWPGLSLDDLEYAAQQIGNFFGEF